jgi:hypothetical protein
MNSVTTLLMPHNTGRTDCQKTKKTAAVCERFEDACKSSSGGCGSTSNGGTVRVFDRNLHPRIPLSFTPLLRLKRLHAYDQCHSSRMYAPLTSPHCKLRPNTEGTGNGVCLNQMNGQYYCACPEGEELSMWVEEEGYGARFQTGFCTRGCHWFPRMFA